MSKNKSYAKKRCGECNLKFNQLYWYKGKYICSSCNRIINKVKPLGYVGRYISRKNKKNGGIKMLKADDKVNYGEGEKPMKFTNFEELKAMVQELKDVVNEHTEIFRGNNLVKKETTEAPYFDDDKVYKGLEEDE